MIRSKIFYYISLIGFFGIFSTTISKNPVLPLFVHSLGGSNSVLGIISALSPLAGILFSFPVGYLSDRLNRKIFLLISATIFLTAPLLYLLVANPWFLIPIRFFHGLATAILGPIASAIIVSTAGNKKGEQLGLYSSATLVGRTLAPLLGGFIITYFLTAGNLLNYKYVYVAAFILAIPVFILTLATNATNGNGHKTLSEAGKNNVSFGQAVKTFLANRKVFSTSLIEMATYFSYGVLETYLPIYLNSLGFSAGKIGLVFSLQILSIALTKPLFGKVADKIDKRTQILVGITIIALATLTLPMFTNYWVLILVSLIFGLGMSFSTVATTTYVAEVAKSNNLGTSLGALSSVMDVGQSSGPFIVGFIATSFSVSVGFSFTGVFCLVMALYFSLAVFGLSDKR